MGHALRKAELAVPDREHLAAQIRAGRVCSVQPLPPSAQAYLAWALWEEFKQPLVWVVDGPRQLEVLHQDLRTLAADAAGRVSLFPARESVPGQERPPSPDLVGERLRTLQRCLAQPGPAIILTCIQALLQKTLAPSELARNTIQLGMSQEHDLEALAERLAAMGYEFTAEVEVQGQASVRGGLLDVWPPSEPWPVRIEFFGSVIDSIRTFDPVEQRSIERCAEVNLSPPSEQGPAGRGGGKRGADLLAYLSHRTRWVWARPEEIRHHAERYREAIRDEALRRGTTTYRTLRKRIAETFEGGQLAVGADGPRPEEAHALDLQPVEALPALPANVMEPDLLEEARRSYLATWQQRAADGWEVHLFFATSGARERFVELGRARGLPLEGLRLHTGALSEGFTSEALRLAVVAESDIFGRRTDTRGRGAARRPRGPRRPAGPRVTEWTDIQPGDFVVHVEHGIGKYLGLYEIQFAGREQEVMSIEYANGAKLYVPVAQAHLLTRYVGVGRQRPRLHTLGGGKWLRDRATAERAIRDLAANLLDTQALRATRRGVAFPPDTHWQHEFEAAFPYRETEDQERAIREVKQDMERDRPMDRLVCGDVGYGKTEVAMRAAFKAVTHGKQVAILVPTTVLAQQHYDTFTARMAAFPIQVRMLSRFQTRAEQRAVIEGVRTGAVDVVIGTHRLLQPDVRFKDMGLLIIDEEQRFGVAQKEHLKHLRAMIDVLTLTATPIPRTLYMSLTGARDMSTIQTPPRERLPIETIVAENRGDVVREAIMRELNRDGQVFYLHNRVQTIHRVKQRLERLAPEARIEVAHGQMPERDLAAVMRRFVAGRFDLLLCTTIIENGVDIPNVNTILIDRADRLGLADLYQLRGRVGRYKHKAYAYLLLPRHGRLFDTARKRIGAIRRYSSLGAGFKVALRDLEIRGAGNLLGAAQSGHIAAVGFDLYCQLLKRTVARLRGEEVPPLIDVEISLDFIVQATASAGDPRAAVIPTDYIEDENLRVQAYRKMAAAVSERDVAELAEELRDRFGPLPPALERLLQVATIRILAAARDIRSVEARGEKIMLMRGQDYLMAQRRFPRLKARDPAGKLAELIDHIRRLT